MRHPIVLLPRLPAPAHPAPERVLTARRHVVVSTQARRHVEPDGLGERFAVTIVTVDARADWNAVDLRHTDPAAESDEPLGAVRRHVGHAMIFVPHAAGAGVEVLRGTARRVAFVDRILEVVPEQLATADPKLADLVGERPNGLEV